MQQQWKHLWAALRRACVARTDRSASVELGEPLLSPWAFWLLIALVRHRTRQRWVAEVIENHLQGEPESLAVAGALGQPEEIAPQGVVPGMTDWEYRFHGRGCELKHRITGESVDVDFYDAEGEWFDGWFYCRYLRRARDLAPPEQRLIDLHPSIDSIMVTLEELKNTGLVIGLQENRAVFTLADEVVEHTAVVDEFCQAWQREVDRFAIAVAVGDWLAACDRLSDQSETTARLTQARADACRRARAEPLAEMLKKGQADRGWLFAFAETEAGDLDGLIAQVLQGPASSVMVGATDLIIARDDPAWCERVFTLLKRLDPNAEIPEPAVWGRCVQFLLKRGYRQSEVLTEIGRARDRELADVALLLLEHVPEHSRTLFQAALRSSVPLERSKAAAVLAVLDEEWGRRDMIEALWESDEPERTAECRAALCCSASPAAHLAVEEWEEKHPYQPQSGPGYSAIDVRLQHSDSFLQHQMDQLHDRVLPLRGRVK